MDSRERRLSILVTVDFSETSGRALAHAADWARRTACDLEVVHVFEHGNGDAASSASGLPHLLEILRLSTDMGLGDLVGPDGESVTVRHHIATGEPGPEILRLAGQLGSSLVIMGATGSGSSDLLLGSVACRVIGHTDCPVAAVTTPGRADGWAQATIFACEVPPDAIVAAAGPLGCRVVLLAPPMRDAPYHALARAIAGSARVPAVAEDRARAMHTIPIPETTQSLPVTKPDDHY